MYKVAEYTGNEATQYAEKKAPFGMGLEKELTQKVKTVIVYGSSFMDPGHDFTRLVAFGIEGDRLATITIDGY
jgi:hypothetical protein